MLRERAKSTRELLVIAILGLFSLAFLATTNADPGKPISGEFSVTMTGVDPSTGELIFEGFRTGDLPGYLVTRTALVRQTGMALHLATRFTLTTASGDTVEGENSAVLNTVALKFHEHGIIVQASDELEQLIGNFVIIQGEVTDVNFMPGVTTATAKVLYVPSQGKKYE